MQIDVDGYRQIQIKMVSDKDVDGIDIYIYRQIEIDRDRQIWIDMGRYGQIWIDMDRYGYGYGQGC